jgi:nucleotide-binding universal stress UspA family protein
MRGTVVCGVTDVDEGRGALAVAAELSERLGLRLVLVHVADGDARLGVSGIRSDSLAMHAGRERAVRLLAHLAAEHGVAGSAEQRSEVGDPATLLGQIAAEEAADLIVVGSRARGRLRRGLESQLARRLETETPVPVVIAPPRPPPARKAAACSQDRR